MTSIKLNQVVYYLLDNKVHSAQVNSICKVDNWKEQISFTKKEKQQYMPFGKAGTFYSTEHGIFNSDEVYVSKEELTQALLKESETKVDCVPTMTKFFG